jgi:hypothetical protein
MSEQWKRTTPTNSADTPDQSRSVAINPNVTVFQPGGTGENPYVVNDNTNSNVSIARDLWNARHNQWLAEQARTIFSVDVLPTAVSEAARIADLHRKGFEHFTADRMQEEFDMGRDRLKKMALRAVRNGCIHEDYQIISTGKQAELWARRVR